MEYRIIKHRGVVENRDEGLILLTFAYGIQQPLLIVYMYFVHESCKYSANKESDKMLKALSSTHMKIKKMGGD